MRVNWTMATAFLATGLALLIIGILIKFPYLESLEVKSELPLANIPNLTDFMFGLGFGFVFLALFVIRKNRKKEKEANV